MTLAHYLNRHGLDVAVYERDTGIAAREAYYRIHINSTGTSSLYAALEPRLWELFLATSGMPDDDMLLFDEQLNLRPGRDKSATEGIGVPTDIPEHLVVCRSTLRRILYLGLEEAVHFGAKVTGYRSHPDGTVTVLLDDGETVEADVLIAADGINSAVRAQRLPQVKVADLAARHIAAKVPITEETKAKLPAAAVQHLHWPTPPTGPDSPSARWSAATPALRWSRNRTRTSRTKPPRTTR